MKTKLKVLLVEDRAPDAELCIDELSLAGFQPEWSRVDRAADFRAALRTGPEIILSDYSMPVFTSLEALKILSESGLDIPFIIVSGALTDDEAAIAMREGAVDYLLKDRLARLGAAIRSALLRVRLRREQGEMLNALRESDARFRQIAEHVDEVLWMVDPVSQKTLYINPQYEKIWGRSCASLYENPRSSIDAIHPEDRARIAEMVQGKERGDYTETYRIVRPDGSIRWIRSCGFAIRDEAGKVYRMVGTAIDITEQKKTEEQLLRSQRFEAIGTLSSGLAHDLNNILAPTLMVTAILREKLSSAHEAELLDIVEKGAQRGANIIQQLLTFTRGVGSHPAPVSPRNLLDAMAAILRETFPREIRIVVEASGGLAPVVVDATQIQQVLMNLCVNARDAMPTGGTLTLLAEDYEIEANELTLSPLAKVGPHVVLSVRDTGCGIAPENVDRIFEPFYTTKHSARGSGLGLSTVAGIVRSHGGRIRVVSQVGVGSELRVYLPIVPAVDAAPPAATKQVSLEGKGELILVVDDEKDVRRSTRLTLEKFGYTVLDAADGREAMRLFLEKEAAVELLVTDLMMPNMNGAALTKSLRRIVPKLKVVATTGLDGTFSQEELREMDVAQVLLKPFSPTDLLRAVRIELENTAPGVR